MQLVVSGNRILAHGDGFLAMGGTVINTDTGKAYQNATVVECENCPSDIGEVGYEYHAGAFVPCAPYGKGDGNLAVVCGEDCKALKDSNMPLSGVMNDGVRAMYCLKDNATPADLYSTIAPFVVPTILVTAPAGSTVTATDGEKFLTAEESAGTWLFYVKKGTWTVTAQHGAEEISEIVIVDAVKQYSVRLLLEKIYGVTWDGLSGSAWSRTNLSARYVDPNPAVNNGAGSSPFDDLYPWSGMVRSTDENDNEVVSIPKFWYKWTRSGTKMNLQIADYPADGFLVSPAHADRGDGSGERDVVYVGRYHCNANGKSVAGAIPHTQMGVGGADSLSYANGADYMLLDYATYWTICMLYLVEYADWDSQKKIGYGCSPDGAIFAQGLTDDMQYHTGTAAKTRETYGATQYRNIEGLWDNVRDYIGNVISVNGNVYMTPTTDVYNTGEIVGGCPTSSGIVTQWFTPSVEGFEYAILPATVTESTEASRLTYSCDLYNLLGSATNRKILSVGGAYAKNRANGLFAMAFIKTDVSSYTNIGYRLQQLPGYGIA